VEGEGSHADKFSGHFATGASLEGRARSSVYRVNKSTVTITYLLPEFVGVSERRSTATIWNGYSANSGWRVPLDLSVPWHLQHIMQLNTYSRTSELRRREDGL